MADPKEENERMWSGLGPGSIDKWRQAYESAVLEAASVIAELEKRNKRLKDALKHYADADNWHAFEHGGLVEEQIVWLGVYGNEGTFPAGPDLAIVALSDLKREKEGDG